VNSERSTGTGEAKVCHSERSEESDLAPSIHDSRHLNQILLRQPADQDDNKGKGVNSERFTVFRLFSVVKVSKGGNVVKAKISEEELKAVIAFHGHWCPGLATGIRVSEIALKEFGRSSDEEIVAVSEADTCAVDAVQFLTGCSVGKGNLILRNIGKMAFSFYRRSDGKAIRIVSKTNVARGTNDEYRVLQEKKNHGTITDEETARLRELRQEHCASILASDTNDLFVIKEPLEPVPPFAPMKKSLVCDECGEMIMETRARLSDGRTLCPPCFERLVPRP